MRPYISGNDITPKNAPAAVLISPSYTIYQRLTISRLSPKLLYIYSLKLTSFYRVLYSNCSNNSLVVTVSKGLTELDRLAVAF